MDSILFCGRQKLALHGHHACGRISPQEPLENDGNFRALLRLHIRAGDVVLQDHSVNEAENAQYTSQAIQNELLETALNLIRKGIVLQVCEAQCFSMICDETMDRGKRELMVNWSSLYVMQLLTLKAKLRSMKIQCAFLMHSRLCAAKPAYKQLNRK